MTTGHEQSNPDVIDRLASPTVRSNLRVAVRWIRGLTLVAAIIGSIPTLTDAYSSVRYGIPWGKVEYVNEQLSLYKANAGCRPDFRPLDPTDGVQVDVGQCPSKDIKIVIKDVRSGKFAEQWIAFGSLERPQTSAGLLDALFPAAHATLPLRHVASGSRDPEPRLRLAQGARYQIMCQKVQPSGKVVRVVRDGAACYLETYSVYRQRVEERKVVQCDTRCPQ